MYDFIYQRIEPLKAIMRDISARTNFVAILSSLDGTIAMLFIITGNNLMKIPFLSCYQFLKYRKKKEDVVG